MIKDLYAVLEVAPNASSDVIHVAYKALARKYHPDTYVGDKSYANARMAEVNEAYAVLCDSIKRAEYDQHVRIESKQSKTRSGESTCQKESHSSHPASSPHKVHPPLLRFSAWNLIKVIVVILLIYSIISGKLFLLFNNTANQTPLSPIATTYLPTTPSENEATKVVRTFISGLQKLDVETAKSLVYGERLSGLTASVVETYSADTNPNDMIASMVKSIRNFDYVIESPVYRNDTSEASIDVRLEVKNLYTVMSIAVLNYSKQMESPNWKDAYILDSILTGKDVDEMTVFRECINEALKESTDTIKYTARFTLQRIDNMWKIISIDNDVEFANVLLGHLAEYIEDMDTGFEIPRS